MNHRFCRPVLVALVLLPMLCATALADLTLTREGQPAATIVIAAQATKSAQFAAYELQWHVQRISGATLPIVGDDVEVPGPHVLVGESAATRALGFKTADFKSREYMVHFLPDALILMGCDQEDRGKVRYQDNWGPQDDPWDKNKPENAPAYQTFPKLSDERGSMFAVYDFLERCCDVRWYRPGELGLVLPRRPTLSVKPVEIRRTPWLRTIELGMGLETRLYDDSLGLWGADPGLNERYDAIAWADVREASRGAYEERKLIESRRRAGYLYLHRLRTGGEAFACNHAFYGYYNRFWEQSKDPNAAKLWEGHHPEYFAQGYTGQPPQMCYTNPGFINQVIQDARDYFDGKGLKPGAVAAGDVFGIGPMDNRSWCKCERCQARLDMEELANNKQFNNGVASNYLFEFANIVARGVAETHPGKQVALMAYAAYAKPPSFPLEPNVAVMLCLHGRNVYAKSLQAHDDAYLKAWGELKVPLRLWLYYCFPQYATKGGGDQGWYCFPGFFAHAAAQKIQLYRQAGVQGIFTEGIAQDVDEYVILRMFDDPSRDVDQLLNEYFTRYYGAAAAPMREMHALIEETYSNPAHYPEGFEGHQTEAVAWGSLGTPERMEKLAGLMAQAHAAAQTDLEKKRVQLFDLSIWQYMRLGRRHYEGMLAQKAAPLKLTSSVYVQKTAAPVPNGDPAQVDWSQALVLDDWHGLWAEPTPRKFIARMTYDDTNFYLQLEDPVDPGGLACQRSTKTSLWVGAYHRGFTGDYWRLFFARERVTGRWPSRTANEGMLIPPTGDAEVFGRRGVKVVSDTSAADRWVVSVAIPLKVVLTGGLQEGDSFYFNAVRQTSEEISYSWLPMFGGINNLSGLGAVTLDPAAVPGPVTEPTPAPVIEAVDETTIQAQSVARAAMTMSNNDALQGKPWVFDTPKIVAHIAGKRPATVRLTDAGTATGPLQEVMFQDAVPEVAIHWDLGPVPAEGRQLRQVKLWRTVAEAIRAKANVKVAVRDAATQAWRDVTEYFLDEVKDGSPASPYRVITITFPPGAVTGFDAIRVVDGEGLAGLHRTRWIEMDAFIAPE